MVAHDEAALIRDGDYLLKTFMAAGVPRREALEKLRESHPATYRAYSKTLPPQWTDTQARTQLVRLAQAHASRHGGSVGAAMKAILLAPKVVGYRVTMARVYLAAGLPKNARREADTALELAPEDRQAKSLMAEVRRASG